MGKEHRYVGESLNNLALTYYHEGRVTQEALAFARRSVEIAETADGPKHPEVATALGTLALLLVEQGEYEPALRLCRRRLEILESGPWGEPSRHRLLLPERWLRYSEGKGVTAKLELSKRSVAILEETLGPENPQVG